MIAVCMPRQMPKNGSAVLARVADRLDHAFDAAHAEAARHEEPVDVARGSARRARDREKSSLDIHWMSTPTSLAMPPWMSASCTLL